MREKKGRESADKVVRFLFVGERPLAREGEDSGTRLGGEGGQVGR